MIYKNSEDEKRRATGTSVEAIGPSQQSGVSASKPKLISRLREPLRSRHDSGSTEKTYVMWVKRFISFHDIRNPAEMSEPEINAFLTHLAVRERVSASTQNQALSALLFLYRHVIQREVGDLGEVIRARKPRRLPVVMTRDEVRAVLSQLEGDKWLMASLMYGAGLRLIECLRLRTQDLDFGASQVIIRDGKGFKDRLSMMPAALKEPLFKHMNAAKAIHQGDLAEGYGRVSMPYALARKYPNASAEWRWQWVSPQERRWRNPKDGRPGSTPRRRFRGSARGQVRRESCWNHEACELSYVSAFIRNSLAGRGLRHSDGSGAARA